MMSNSTLDLEYETLSKCYPTQKILGVFILHIRVCSIDVPDFNTPEAVLIEIHVYLTYQVCYLNTMLTVVFNIPSVLLKPCVELYIH